MGNDGSVTAIDGTTITMQEEAVEGGASYTVDTSGATFVKTGATGTIADIKVGDKIFVDGSVTGTTVVATKVMDGRGRGGPDGFWHGSKSNNGASTTQQ